MKHFYMALLTAALAFGMTSTSASAQTLHLIAVTDSGDESIGTDVAIDAINVFHLAKGAAEKSGMTFKPQVLASAKIPSGAYKRGGPRNPNLKGLTKSKKVSASIGYDKAKVRKSLKNLKVGKNDVIWFHYAGHGFRWSDQKAKWPALDLGGWASSDADGAALRKVAEKSLQLAEVISTLEKKGARLTISISDSCNEDAEMTMPKGAKGRGKDKLTQGLTRLFKHAKGYIRISSTKPGELAWGDGDIGGVFSFKFVTAIMAEAKNKGNKADWKNLLKPFNGAISMQLKSGDTTDAQHPRVESKISYSATGGNSNSGGQSGNGGATTGSEPNGKMRTLKLFVNFSRRDGFTAATEKGYRAAKKSGYRFWGDQGRIFAKKMPGTVPLNLYWSSSRKDNFSTSTRAGNAAARAAGYKFVRVQGYVYPKATRGTVPLYNLWGGPARWADNFTTTNGRLVGFLSKRLRWKQAGIEGHVLKASGSRGKSKLSSKQLGLFKKAKKDTKGLDFDKYLAKAKKGGKGKGGAKKGLTKKQVMAGMKKHCRADIKRLCKRLKKRTPRNVLKCLSKNRKKVSKRCQKFLRALKKRAGK